MKAKIIGLIFLMLMSADSFSQCAMCRAQLENNISNGNIGIAAGINFGILYLFAAPYLAISVIAFFWFRSSKRNALKLNKSNMAM